MANSDVVRVMIADAGIDRCSVLLLDIVFPLRDRNLEERYN